jgi:glycosyltransferase involved in cell wall biosynthesis
MKVAVCSTDLPFVGGGARNLALWLSEELVERGHQVETVLLPQADDQLTIYEQMMSFRWIDLSDADRLICLRPQAHFVPHPHKVVWFIHHLRIYYDLWDSPYRWFDDTEQHRALRRVIHRADTHALSEASVIYTNSSVVSRRLRDFNGLSSTVLLPPVRHPERYRCGQVSDEILYVGRIEHPKRAHLLIDALAQCRSAVRLRIVGESTGGQYPMLLRSMIDRLGLKDRVTFEDRWVSEEEKIEALATCLAVAYCPVDEDSYGYSTLEAAHSGKPTVTTSDSGGVLEFIRDGETGLVAAPNAPGIASAFDALFFNSSYAQELGERARRHIGELNISWDHVIGLLLA